MNRQPLGTVAVLCILSSASTTQGQTVAPFPIVSPPTNGSTAAEAHIVVRGDGSIAAAIEPALPASDRLAYSNTLGEVVASIPETYRIADDLVLTATNGAQLSRYAFWVTGQANDTEPGDEPYIIEFGLYDACPSAGGVLIPGSGGEITITDPADVSRLLQVEFMPTEEVSLPTSIWFAFDSSRPNVGLKAGGTPFVGFSDDALDLPGFACAAGFGGYPERPYASFDLELWVREDAPKSFPAYRNVFDAGYSLRTGGGSVQFADDLELDVESCDLIGYEVGIRDFGFYQFELHEDVAGMPAQESIPGTRGWFFNNTTNGFRLARINLDTPVPIRRKKVWISFKVNNPAGGWANTGSNATLGLTRNGYARRATELSDWVSLPYPPGRPHDSVGVYAVLHCAGEAPVGACCDMIYADENGDAVCREVPRSNCFWPPRRSTLLPAWVESASCDADPFPMPCGAAACCAPDDVCFTITERECHQIEPVELARLWSRGRYCDGEEDRFCPFSACLQRGGTCDLPHDGTGCQDYFCCTDVCDIDPYCCRFEWDELCAETAMRVDGACAGVKSRNAACFGERIQATQVAARSTTLDATTGSSPSEHDFDPCCRVGGDAARPLGGESWFRFIAETESAILRTRVDEPDVQTLIEVFRPTTVGTIESECASLESIGCNQLFIEDGQLSRVTVNGLVPNQPYYIGVDSTKYATYWLDLIPIDRPEPVANDLCEDAILIPPSPFDVTLASASMACDDETAWELRQQDVFYQFTPRLNGPVTIDATRGDVAVEAFEGCECPPALDRQVGLARSVRLESSSDFNLPLFVGRAGECYLIRIANPAEPSNDPFSEGIRANVSVLEQADAPCVEIGPEVPTAPLFVVDARRPYDAADPANIEGFKGLGPRSYLIYYAGPPEVCETAINRNRLDAVTPHALQPNGIADGGKVFYLLRPITPGERTEVHTTPPDGGEPMVWTYYSLPGDVNGDLVVSPADLIALIDAIKETKHAPWCDFSTDINRDGATGPADILAWIDLAVGNEHYAPWLGARIDPNAPCE